MRISTWAVPLLMSTVLAAQEKLDLTGVFSIGQTNADNASRLYQGARIDSNASELNWSLDLSLRTYLLDPRFLTFTLEPTIARGFGHSDAVEIEDAAVGGAFYVDFLRNSYYPLRFHYVNQDSDYVQKRITSANTARNSIGFDWLLRKPKLPPVFLNYDSSEYDYEFAQFPSLKSHTNTLYTGTRGTLRGWASDFSYNKNSGTEAFTHLQTAADLVRAATRKQLTASSGLFAHAQYQDVKFTSPNGGSNNLPFFNVREDLNTRHSEKLNSILYHQYYRTGGIHIAEPDGTVRSASAAFNTLGEQVTYRILPFLTVGETADATFNNALTKSFETATRFTTASGLVSFQQRFGFVQTRAHYSRGISIASTNFGRNRAVSLNAYGAGLDVGDKRYLFLSGDYGASMRPDIFQIGGSFAQHYFNASAESGFLRKLEMRASLGKNDYDYVNVVGRERVRLTSYSAAIINRRFTLQASRSADQGLRNFLLSTIVPDAGRIFHTVPIDAVLNAPLATTIGVITTASLTVRPHRLVEFQARYFRQRDLFTVTPNLLVSQYESFLTARFGKFFVTAGALYQQENIFHVHDRRRLYYLYRISRTFRIF